MPKAKYFAYAIDRERAKVMQNLQNVWSAVSSNQIASILFKIFKNVWPAVLSNQIASTFVLNILFLNIFILKKPPGSPNNFCVKKASYCDLVGIPIDDIH